MVGTTISHYKVIEKIGCNFQDLLRRMNLEP